MTNAQIREYVIESLGAAKCRIKQDGTIHALGKMPNSTDHGWYLVGYKDELVSMWSA